MITQARTYRGVRKTNLILADDLVVGNVIALVAGEGINTTVELVTVTEVVRHPYGDNRSGPRMVTVKGQAYYGGQPVERTREFRFLDFVTAL